MKQHCVIINRAKNTKPYGCTKVQNAGRKTCTDWGYFRMMIQVSYVAYTYLGNCLDGVVFVSY